MKNFAGHRADLQIYTTLRRLGFGNTTAMTMGERGPRKHEYEPACETLSLLDIFCIDFMLQISLIMEKIICGRSAGLLFELQIIFILCYGQMNRNTIIYIPLSEAQVQFIHIRIPVLTFIVNFLLVFYLH